MVIPVLSCGDSSMSFLDRAHFWIQATQLGKVTQWSSQRVTRVRTRRLRRLVRFAVENSPLFLHGWRSSPWDAASIRPAPPLMVTNLANTVQPLVRYELGDRVVMATEPGRCGNRLPRIARIEGRSADLFQVGEEAQPEFITGARLHPRRTADFTVCPWTKRLPSVGLRV